MPLRQYPIINACTATDQGGLKLKEFLKVRRSSVHFISYVYAALRYWFVRAFYVGCGLHYSSAIVRRGVKLLRLC
jgi:hypothetical protein